jgi:hypothetical protein
MAGRLIRSNSSPVWTVSRPGLAVRRCDEETGKPSMRGAYASQRLRFRAAGQARDLTNACRAEVRTGLGKSDRPGSQRGFRKRGQSESHLRAARARDFYLDNGTHGSMGGERKPDPVSNAARAQAPLAYPTTLFLRRGV